MMPNDKPKIRKWKPHTKKWETEANAIARNAAVIHPCGRCGYPVAWRNSLHATCRGCNTVLDSLLGEGLMSISDDELEQLERLAAESQEGPWSMAWNDADTSVAVKSYRHYEVGRYVAAINWELQPTDAAYIAYANPERIGRLVVELRLRRKSHSQTGEEG